MCLCVSCACGSRRITVASAIVRRPVLPRSVEDGRCTSFFCDHYYFFKSLLLSCGEQRNGSLLVLALCWPAVGGGDVM